MASDDEPRVGLRRVRARRAPSLADVAREAGVAPITASRVANGAVNVEPTTRQRVLDVMSRIGYRPNVAARALATGRSKSIGVVTYGQAVPWNINEFVTAAAELGYTITLLPVEMQSESAGDAYGRLSHQGVDGAIVLAERHRDSRNAMLLPEDLPVVLIAGEGGDRFSVVDSDHAAGAVLATEHLLGLGHATVHHVTGPKDAYASIRRSEAWRSTLEAHGRRVPQVLAGDWSIASGRDAVDALLQDGATAIFASNDWMALGVLQRLHELGVAVPGGASVIGFDDVSTAEGYWPALSTIKQSFEDVGRVAVETLVERMAGGGAARRLVVPVELTLRASTGPPPS